ncbi:MAG: hypothetical protein Q9196_005645 [Gyalolechia fulgens]
MYVAAYCDWRIHLDNVAFFDQQLARFVAKVADGGFGDGFAGAEFGDVTVQGEFANGILEGQLVGNLPVQVAHEKSG